ncbi:hypothetical protein F4801DRAFT_528579 [Xylaria longipes]|nr:hypothetical protein F4801DRAFT_528579 [Xylaria longipes]
MEYSCFFLSVTLLCPVPAGDNRLAQLHIHITALDPSPRFSVIEGSAVCEMSFSCHSKYCYGIEDVRLRTKCHV